MPLKRATKSVIFHDGIADGTDRFLVEPPAVDYAENVHPHKDGSFQKRPGFGDSALTTVPSPGETPSFIHGIGNNLHVLTENGPRTWDGQGWEETPVTGFIGTQQMLLETAPTAGLGQVEMFLEYESGALNRYVMAFEVREESSSDAPNGYADDRPRHILIQTFSPEGELLTQYRIDNARAPKLVESLGTKKAMLFYQDQSASNLLRFGGVNPQGQVQFTFLVTTNPATSFGQPSHGDLLDDYGPMLFTRLGGSADRLARYHVVPNPDNFTYLLFYHRKSTGAGDYGGLYMARLSVVGDIEIEEELYDNPQGLGHEALDMVYVGNNECIILYADYYAISPSRYSRARIERRSTTGSFAFTWRTTVLVDQDAGNSDFYGRTYAHGGLALDANNDIAWFVHDVGEAVVQEEEHVRDRNTGLHHGKLTYIGGLTVGTARMLPHHRLATRPVFFEDELYCAVQQWSDMTPYTRNVGAYDDYTSVIGAIKPRSTVLACFDQDNNVVRPVASLDAGNSKTNEYAESEWTNHVPKLWVDGDRMVIPNRVTVYAEDLSMNMSDVPAIVGFFGNWARFGSAEAPSDALCRVYSVSKGVEAATVASSAALGDGLVLSTAVPLWFDGKFFGELTPLDSPEIISVQDERMLRENLRPLLAFDANDKSGQSPVSFWTKLQVVTGYYDSRGNKHRSAPSSIVYVDDLAGGNNASPEPNPGGAGATAEVEYWRGKKVFVYYTLPLTYLPADLEYFAELYGCPADEDDLKLIETAPIDLSTTPSPDDLVITAQLVRYRGQYPGVFVRPPRTSRSIYTAGGDLAAEPWPAFNLSVTTSTRLWVIDAIRNGRVIPSKLFEDYVSPEYNPSIAINLGDERNLTAIGKLDDKVVVFEPNDVHVIYGEGPDNRGQGQDFAVHYISTDVGCEDQQSVIETPAGLIFYSKPRGFYMLDRNLQIKFIGDGIEEIARDVDVVAATLVPEFGEVRFIVSAGSLTPTWPDDSVPLAPQVVTDAGVDQPPRPIVSNALNFFYPCVVYNYERDAWTTYSNYRGTAATMYQNKYTMLNPDWSIWQESATSFTDPVPTNRTLIRTPWIRLSEQIQNYERLWRVTFLGRYLSSLQDIGGGVYEAGDVIIRAWFDYEENVDPQVKRYRFQDFGFDPFNAVPRRGERFQFKWTPERGRCQAVKFEMEEVLSEDTGEGLTYGLGPGFEIVAADIEVGVSGMQTRYLAGAVSK